MEATSLLITYSMPTELRHLPKQALTGGPACLLQPLNLALKQYNKDSSDICLCLPL